MRKIRFQYTLCTTIPGPAETYSTDKTIKVDEISDRLLKDLENEIKKELHPEALSVTIHGWSAFGLI